MGQILNKGNDGFASILRSGYVDKSGLIAMVNGNLFTERRYMCVTRSRRFGKSVAAKMLYAYYERSMDTRSMFDGLAIAVDPSFDAHLNSLPVIYIDATDFTTRLQADKSFVSTMQELIIRELKECYPDIDVEKDDDMMRVLTRIVDATKQPFFMIIDEWDAICRELGGTSTAFDDYVSLLRRLFKGSDTDRVFAGVYMTGILPIKRYNTQSALNNFDEYSMISPADLAPFFGFNSDEVKTLCDKAGMNMEEISRWYDGYQIGDEQAMYNPFSVVRALQRKRIESYWASTNAFEDLKNYITMNFDGLKDDVLLLISGDEVPVNTTMFSNDMREIRSKDDVLTVLCHLGYLTYNWNTHKARIPNNEVRQEFENTLQFSGWTVVSDALKQSEWLLDAALDGDEERVAAEVDAVHSDSASILRYNDENSLACALTLAFYAARGYYKIIRELPTGKGFADIVLLPKPGVERPAMILELKWNESAETAINQIHSQQYVRALEGYVGEVVLVGINYDKMTKEHTCKIEHIKL